MRCMKSSNRRTLGAHIRHVARATQRAFRLLSRRRRRRLFNVKIMKSRQANLLLAQIVSDNQPTLVTRLGTTEASTLVYFLKNNVSGECQFPEKIHTTMRTNSGFFPTSDSLLSRFCRETLVRLKEIDVLGLRAGALEKPFWNLESETMAHIDDLPRLVDIEDLLPIGKPYSWTQSLAGKKVLVIHPFEKSIRSQFQRRELLFSDSKFLPDFSLDVLRAEQTAGDNQELTKFPSWFDSLNSMKQEIGRRDFDVALIGAGAYGMFLASECKRIGKTAIHIGGALQLLFGIYGRRWTDPTSPDSAKVLPLINEHWAGPAPSEVPAGVLRVEGGSYWP